MKKKIQPVILCGGSGKRLWPISRKSQPKQFVSIAKGKSLLQQTLDRIASPRAKEFFLDNGYQMSEEVLCIGSELHRYEIRDNAEELGIPIRCVFEPVPRNTAAAMAAIACYKKNEGQDLLVFCPSDHFIKWTENYLRALLVGFNEVHTDEIITLGVKPTFGSTAYGYIEVENVLSDVDIHSVIQFIEKPPEEIAAKLVKKSNIFWNAGSFIMQVDTLYNALNKYRTDTLNVVRRSLEKAETINRDIFLDEENFRKCSSESIDYAVLENYKNLKLVELRTEWSDVGSWNSLAKLFNADGHNNRSNSEENSFFHSSNSFVYSSTSRPVIVVGMNNTIIAETADAVMVADSGHSESIKEVVEDLEKRDIKQAQNHRKVNRPWGTFDSIDSGKRFQVKRITVKPGGRLSLQRHEKRAEHWVVIKGTAKVTRGKDVFILEENESTFIPIGVIHRLENPGTDSLEIIEVQTGNYFGEDDIYRLEDEYGRQK